MNPLIRALVIPAAYIAHTSIKSYILYSKVKDQVDKNRNDLSLEVDDNRKFTATFFGDSTAYGVGASSYEKTLSGLFSKNYKDFSVVNFSKVGAKIKDVIEQVQKAKNGEVAIICTTGVDIIFFSSLKSVDSDLKVLLDVASVKFKKVILLTPVNLGKVKKLPMNTLYGIRSNIVSKFLEKYSLFYNNVTFLNYLDLELLYKINCIDDFLCSDGVHPNDFGYEMYFSEIRNKIDDYLKNKPPLP